MTMIHWATQYIGRPWARGAEGPDAFSCWGFLRHIQREHYGRDLPMIDADPDDAAELAGLFAGHPERSRWRRIDRPEEGAGVIVHRPLHVGVWLPVDGGGVLHCVRGAGVIFTRDAIWPFSGFGRREFYRHEGMP